MSTNTDRYYTNTGAVPATGVMTLLAGGIVTSALLGLPLALLNYWLSNMWVALVTTIGYGAIVGVAVRYSAKIAHVRHPNFTRWIAGFIGIVAVYLAWVWHLWAKLQIKFPDQPNWNFGEQFELFSQLAGNPEGIFQYMQLGAALGVWSLFGFTPKGIVLYGIWAIEALFIIGTAVAVSVNAKLSYCEGCRRWTRREEGVAQMPPTDSAELRDALEAENYGVLDELRSQPYDLSDRFDAGVATCMSCEETSFLTISHVRIIDDGNGGTTEAVEPLILNLIVPREVVEHIRQPIAPTPAE